MAFFDRRRRPFRRLSDGTYAVELDDGIRAMLGQFVAQLRDLLSTDDPALARLFPPPYGDDEERNQGYAALAGAELVEGRLASLDVVESRLDATVLTEDELQAWMRSINDLRLVLGTSLGIEDEVEGPRDGADAQSHAVYEFLGMLLESVVDALAR